MNIKSAKLNSGFTLIELIIVIVILGILAVSAFPKFLSISDDAQLNKVKAISAAFKGGVKSVQLKWVLDGEPGNTGNNTGPVVVYDGTDVTVSESTGLPVGSTGSDTGITINRLTDCVTIFNSIMKTDLEIINRTNGNNPSATARLDYDILVTRENDDTGGDVCHYYLIDSMDSDATNPGNTTPIDYIGFSYNALTGDVSVFDFN